MPAQNWVLIADLHTGSPVGLTDTPQNPVQEQLLNRYIDCIGWHRSNPDVVVVNGDLTEGIDLRFDVDNPIILKQMESAATCIAMWHALKEYILVTGTVAHSTAQLQEMEEHAAKCLKLKHFELYGTMPEVTVTRKLKTTINGWFTLQARHYIGRSIIPHGRMTAPLRSLVWEALNAAMASKMTNQVKRWADLLVFAHVHYFGFADTPMGAVMTLPCWKALGDKFGEEICDGSVQLGAVKLAVGETESDGWSYQKRLYAPAVVPRTESR